MHLLHASKVFVGAALVFASQSSFAGPIAEQTQSIADALSRSEQHLSISDAEYIQRQLDRVKDVLRDYDDVTSIPFRLTAEGTRLDVYAKDTGNLLFSWYNHDQLSTRGNVLALLDSTKEFRAVLYAEGNLLELVGNWKDTLEYRLFDDYIGIIDTKGIAQVYSTREKKELVGEWKNTVKYHFDRKFIVFLDNEAKANLNVFNTLGNKVIDLQGISTFNILDTYTLQYTQNSVRKSLNLQDYLD